VDHPIYKETWRQIEQANRIGIEFLVTDLDVGLTFLQTAEITRLVSTRERDLEKALVVYRTVTRLLPRVVLSEDDWTEINEKLEELRTKLENAGCRLDS
jgi:hypothetical protein